MRVYYWWKWVLLWCQEKRISNGTGMEKCKRDGKVLFGVKVINTPWGRGREGRYAVEAPAIRLLLILHIFFWFLVKNTVPFKPSNRTFWMFLGLSPNQPFSWTYWGSTPSIPSDYLSSFSQLGSTPLCCHPGSHWSCPKVVMSSGFHCTCA